MGGKIMGDHIWLIAGLIMTGLFSISAFVFIIFKEKASCLIVGYNFEPKEERNMYDLKGMSKDMRNFCLICSGIFFSGAVTTLMWGGICFWISVEIWVVYLFTNSSIEDRKAYGELSR